VFLNNADDEDVKDIIRLLSAKAEEHREAGFKAFVYFLDGTPEQLKKLNAELKADNIALALIPDKERAETLELYAVNEKAQSTVLVYKSREVTEKVVNFQDDEDGETVKGAIDKICE
jgi:hypothetical protein